MIATILTLAKTVILSLYIIVAGGDKSTLNNEEGYNRPKDNSEVVQPAPVDKATTATNIEKGKQSTANTNHQSIVGIFTHILVLLVNSVKSIVLDHLGMTLAVTILSLGIGIHSRFS
ncbi:MAG: hypothetical protein HXX14_00520 [Bacteroidetes bacterium]|nr:hypothetical protein [Bacteroidota bacterium]